MNQDELRDVLTAAAGAYDVLGELGRNEQEELVCLAREMTSGELVAVQVDSRDSAESSAAPPSLTVYRVLDPSVRAKVVRGVVGAERYEPLGAMRKPTGESVTFARERSSGEIVSLPASEGGAAGSRVTPRGTPLSPPVGFPGSAPDGSPAHRTGMRTCPSCRTEYGPEVRFCSRDGTILTALSLQHGLIGEVIADRYRIVRHIGEGGFGQVFLAEHVKMGRLCAVKVMNTSLRHDPDAVGRFHREAANTSQIHHPHVAVIYDFGETAEGLTYLVMEYVEGDSLGATLKYDGAMPAARAVPIAAQIADALTGAHALGIVHRDLKPDNILISQRREHGDWVKVVDFGIAKATQGDWQNITRTGFVVGTLEYMSPEQITGDPVDGRSDLYSLGCVLFEMLVGEQAFTGPSGQLVLTRRLTEAPPRPSDRNPEIPPILDSIVERLLARSADERFATAEEVRDALLASLRSPATTTPAIVATPPDEPAEIERPSSSAPSLEQPVAVSSGTAKPASNRAAWIGGGVAVTAAAIAVIWFGGIARQPIDSSSLDTQTVESTEPIADNPLLLTGSDESDVEPVGGPTTADTEPLDVSPPPTTPATAELRIEGVPVDARVTVNGRPTSGSRLTLPSGEHRVHITAQGYEAYEATVGVRAGDQRILAVQMRAVPPAPPAEPTPTVAAAQPAETPVDPGSVAAPADGAGSAAAIAEIRQVLARYAQALESRDMGQVRAVFPNLSTNEQSTWQGFFRNVRDLRVTLQTLETPRIDGPRAEAAFSLTLQYTDASGPHQIVQSYRSVLGRAAGGAWQLDSVSAQ